MWHWVSPGNLRMFAFVALALCSFADRVIKLCYRLLMVMRALICSGGTHICYVPSRKGPPRAGRPGRNQLCVAEVRVPSGGALKCLMRGPEHPDPDRLERDVWDLETVILDATLTVELYCGEVISTSVQELLYGTPREVYFSPMDLVVLAMGREIQDETRWAQLRVSSIGEAPLCFYTYDLIDRKCFFSSSACNSHEEDTRSAPSRGSDAGSLVRGV